ncbi:MAG: hypothetical protein ACLSA2_05215 [Candidatus Gastranaerophilaceae bacterium]
MQQNLPFYSPKITGDNSSKSCFNYRQINDINDSFNFEIASVENFAPDILLTYYPIQKIMLMYNYFYGKYKKASAGNSLPV